jgi:hypothetical protein
VGKLLKWFDVGTNWRLGVDRFIKLCAMAIVVNWLLDMLYVLPVEDSKSILKYLFSYIQSGDSDE